MRPINATDLAPLLRKITEGLAGEMGRPAQTAPDWSPFEWIVARAVSSLHGVSPLLSRTVHWQGSPEWAAFLQEQRAHTAARHVRIVELLQRLDEKARAAGLAAVALKGAALHALGIYQPGDRPMADIDLLVRPADAARTAALLQSLGFLETSRSWKERAFTPMEGQEACDWGEHANNKIKIELHESIGERLPWQITDVTASIFPAQPHPGLNAYSSISSLMTHVLLHAAGTMPMRALRLLHLHDLAQLSARMSATDWEEVLAHCSPRRLWWGYPPLELVARYFPGAIPPTVLASFRNQCPRLLARVSRRRSLYDVSFSYLWIDAFPGIEWSQSAAELLHYAASRVKPGGEHVRLRRHAAKSESWFADSEWHGLSQSRRVLRWVTSRPHRPLTMHAVRAAMARTQRPDAATL